MLQYLSTPNQTDSKPKDLIFLENLINVLNQELDNPDFKLESLSEFLNMSYSAIYKKCQTLTGETLVGLFRSLRLKKAAILICKENYSISEACFTVGFNDPKYFTKTFKSHFKLTPTEFKKKAEGSNIEDFLKIHKLSSLSS
jgi:AraC-like DNA-binding protein